MYVLIHGHPAICMQYAHVRAYVSVYVCVSVHIYIRDYWSSLHIHTQTQTHTNTHTHTCMCVYVHATDISGIVHVCVCVSVFKCMPQTSAASSPGLRFDTRSCQNVFVCVWEGGSAKVVEIQVAQGAQPCSPSSGGGAAMLLSLESERAR